MVKYYAGIGSRETPPNIQNMMTNFAALAEGYGWTLRSGGANGADAAFEKGVRNQLNKEIFLPWGAFNGNKSRLFPPSDLAYKVAEQTHPNWAACSQAARKLHARNMHQVLGRHLAEPASFIVCWTKDAKLVGGTSTALRAAIELGIPIFNLGGSVDEAALEAILKG